MNVRCFIYTAERAFDCSKGQSSSEFIPVNTIVIAHCTINWISLPWIPSCVRRLSLVYFLSLSNEWGTTSPFSGLLAAVLTFSFSETTCWNRSDLSQSTWGLVGKKMCSCLDCRREVPEHSIWALSIFKNPLPCERTVPTKIQTNVVENLARNNFGYYSSTY